MQHLRANYNYDRDGLLTRLSFGNRILNYSNSPANGLLTAASVSSLSESWAYNGFAEPVAYQMRVSGSPRLGFAYTRDRLGRIAAITETTPAGSQNTAYQYDLAGRLVQVMQEGEVVAQYAYDDNSNRISAQYSGHLASALGACAPSSGVITAQVDAQDRLLSYGRCSYAYGANGELQSKTDNGQTTSYQYDEFGNLRQVSLPDGRELSYAIDGLNRRIGKYIDGQLQGAWLYKDQLNPVAELDANGNVVSIFAYGEKSQVPSLMHKNGQTYRFITDHLGSVREVIDAENGQVAQALHYDAWGNVLHDSNPGFQPFGYAGGLYDRDTGLTRFGARDYDPVTGRWTAKDPIGFGGGDSNLYLYTYANPINYIDPTGLISLCEAMKDVMNNDPRFIDGSWFDPLEVGTEYIPDGGHGPTNANFTHSDGKDYDIQYVQMGWSATHTYNRVVAHSLYFSYMMFVAAMQDKEYFRPENILPNTRGYEMGINGAIKYGSFNDLYEEQCGCNR